MSSMNSDLLALTATTAMLGAYHLYLRMRLRRNSHYTIQAVNKAARVAWVEKIMGSSNKDILAVQTLRNSTMAGTFLASTAVLLIIGVLNLDHLGSSEVSILEAFSLSEPSPQATLIFKQAPLLMGLFSAFFFFSLAIRMYNHVGYLINSGGHPASPVNPTYVARLLNRGGWYYSLGMRSYYLSVPFVFWLLGPAFLVLSGTGLIVVLYHVDRAPNKGAEDDKRQVVGMPRNKRGEPALDSLQDQAAA
jgi:uncharacterized membrane protein